MARLTREEVERERASIRSRFGANYDRLSALLFEEDPVGINFDVNPDEYDLEAGSILPRLTTCRSAQDVQLVVHDEFCRWFDSGTAGPSERYAKIAARIWAELPGVFAER